MLGALGEDVLGSPWDKLLIIAVLTSAAASTQTTILPTTRATLSMASHGALPKTFAKIHPRHLTPSVSTIWMCAVSIVVFVVLNTVSSNILADSVTATGFGIAFYYGLTGLACPWFFRHELFKSARNLILVGLLPLLGGIILLGDPRRQRLRGVEPRQLGDGERVARHLAAACDGAPRARDRDRDPGRPADRRARAVLPLEDRGRRPRSAGGIP